MVSEEIPAPIEATGVFAPEGGFRDDLLDVSKPVPAPEPKPKSGRARYDRALGEVAAEIAERAGAAARAPGSRSTYSAEIGAALCARVAAGQSLKAACDEEGVRHKTARDWLIAHAEFSAEMDRARAAQADTFADEIVSIADTEIDPNVARVRIEARKWVSSKLLPRRYGERVTQDVEVTVRQAHETTDDARARALALLLAKSAPVLELEAVPLPAPAKPVPSPVAPVEVVEAVVIQAEPAKPVRETREEREARKRRPLPGAPIPKDTRSAAEILAEDKARLEARIASGKPLYVTKAEELQAATARQRAAKGQGK